MTRLGLNLHLYPSRLTHESRMDRICSAVATFGLFAEVHQVGVAGEGLPPDEVDSRGFRRLRIAGAQQEARGLVGKATAALSWSIRVLQRYRGEDVACVNAHSLAVLPLATLLAARHRAKLIYDTHELETETNSARGVRLHVLRALEAALIGRADAVSVVSPGIADWYAQRYRMPRPFVVRNMPDRLGAVTPVDLRSRLGIPGDATLFLYQGLLGRGRLVEEFLSAFVDGGTRHLVLLGYGALEPMVREAAAAQPNIHFVPAVPPSEVLAYTAAADVGLCGVEDVCLSYRLSLPNKLFEYLSVGVPVLAPALPDIAAFLGQTGAGWIVPHKAEWRNRVESLSAADIEGAREAARRVGTSVTWQAERVKLRTIYEDVYPSLSE